MSEFINGFGKENFLIMIAIVFAIIIALVLILIIERHNSKKEKSDIGYDDNSFDNRVDSVSYSNDISSVSVDEEEFLDDSLNDDSNKNDEVVYVENENSYDSAKEKLEEVTRKLIDEKSDLIDHTHYEVEQEEKSIISYDELVEASHDIDYKNDRLLADEGEAAITIEELYKRHENEESVIDETEKPEVKVNNPVFEDEPKKFKNSDVISPVFGIYSGEEKPVDSDVLREMNKVDSPADLENEIRRTEDFLSELKRLKNKLD